MSMPEFPMPNPDMTRDQALNMLLSSIALEELALSHIMNAEGEKIQYTLGNPSGKGCPTPINDILSVNQSVTALLEMVMQNQLLLKNKMEKVLEHLPRPSQQPCTVTSPCCASWEAASCFQVIPGSYEARSAVQWYRSCCGCHCVSGKNCEKIPLPAGGSLSANVTLEFCCPGVEEHIVAMQLSVHCLNQAPTCQLLYGTVSRCQTVLSRDVTLTVPCCNSPCYASFTVHSPDTMQIKQGYFSFRRG